MDKITSPEEYLGNFGGYIEQVRKDLEAFLEDPDQYDSVAERAKATAPFIAAQRWLVERWGEEFPCPVCQNIEWSVSEIERGGRPQGFLSFHVTCAYCGNTMQVVPGLAEVNEPQIPTQPHFPDQ